MKRGSEKRIVSAVLALVLAFALLPVAAFGAETVDSGYCGGDSTQPKDTSGYYTNLTWTLDSAGTLTISGTGKMWDDYYSKDYPWKTYQSSVRAVVIEEGVTTVGIGAFIGYEDLTSVSFPESLLEIGYTAFYDCGLTGQLTLPSKLQTIGFRAFSRCKALTGTLSLPDSITKIDSAAFMGCGFSGQLTLPDKLNYLGAVAFSYCGFTGSVTIPKALCTLQAYQAEGPAFLNCPGITAILVEEGSRNFSSVDGVLYSADGTSILCCPGGKTGRVTIPSAVTQIGDYAFSNCEKLTGDLDLRNITSMGKAAFLNCCGLGTVTLPSSLTKIPDMAFSGCSGLSGTLVIPASVMTIGSQTFYNCAGITELSLPNGLTTLENSAFMGCAGLREVTLPKSLTSVGTMVFSDCEQLKDIYYLGTAAQWNRTTAKSWNPYDNKVATLHTGCVSGSIPGSGLVWRWDESGVLTISGSGSMPSFSVAPWLWYSLCITAVEVQQGVTRVSGGAFRNCLMLQEVILADSVTNVGAEAFSGCGALKSVVCGTGLRTLGAGTFRSCGNLQAIHFSGTAPQCGADVFSGCTKAIAYYRPGVQGWYSGTWQGLTCTAASTVVTVPRTLDQTDDSEFVWPVTFNEDWFDGSSFTYQHDLATTSLLAAMTSFNRVGSGNNDNYADADRHLRQFYERLGFEDYTSYNYVTKPTTDSVAFGIAKRAMQDNEGDYTLVAVTVRSGAYGAEWASNFTLGWGENHEGFQQAAETVWSWLYMYLNDRHITGRVKFWVDGYSRGAATANLLGYRLDNFSTAGRDYTWSPEDVFVYCFEVPQGCSNAFIAGYENNKNIFNIVNPVDFVPKVAPYTTGNSSYRYRNIGTMLYVPSRTSSPAGSSYSSWETAMRNNLNMIASRAGVSNFTYTVDGYNQVGQALSLDLAVELLFDTVLQDKNVMVSKLQPCLRKLMTALSDTSLLGISQSRIDALSKDLLGAVLNALKNPFGISSKSLRDALSGVLAKDLPGFSASDAAELCRIVAALIVENKDSLTTPEALATLYALYQNLDGVPMGHMPELELAWMLTLDGCEDFTKNTRRVGRFNCPVDVRVYNSDNQLEAAIVNNEVQTYGSTVYAYVDGDGQKCFVFPGEEAYRVEVEATDSGNFTCAYYEYDGGSPERVVTYEDVAITDGDTFTGTVGAAEAEQSTAYTMTGMGVAHEYVGDEACILGVDTETEGHGRVEGGGNVVVGEFAQLTAIPDEGETFLGWYENETPVSTEESLRVQMLNNRCLTAKFTATQSDCRVLFDEAYCSRSGVMLSFRLYNYTGRSEVDLTLTTPGQTGTYSGFDGTSGTYEVPVSDFGITCDEGDELTLNIAGQAGTTRTVVCIPMTSFRLTGEEATLSVGESVTLSALPKPANAYDGDLAWSSSNSSVATVDESGLVTAVGCGSCTITAATSDGTLSGQCAIDVPLEVDSLTLSETQIYLDAQQTRKLTAQVQATGAVTPVWTSLDPAVAAVDENGLVTAVAPGVTFVQASDPDGTVCASCGVEVAGASLTGQVQCGTDSVLVELLDEDTGEVLDTDTATDGTYHFERLRFGVYTLRFSAEDSATYTTEVLAGGTDQTAQPVTLFLRGDVNGSADGAGDSVTAEDMQCLYDFLSTGWMTGALAQQQKYFLAVADVNDDGIVNILDYQALYEKIRKSAKNRS